MTEMCLPKRGKSSPQDEKTILTYMPHREWAHQDRTLRYQDSFHRLTSIHHGFIATPYSDDQTPHDRGLTGLAI